MARGEVEVAALVARQHGVVSFDQLAAAGMSKATVYRRVAQGHLVVVHPGVFRHGAHGQSWPGRLLAACLSIDGLASHRSGARLWGAESIRGGIIEVTVDTGTASERPGVVVHRSSQLDLADPMVIDGIPVTGPARTLLDLAAVVPPRLLESAVDDLLRLRHTTWPELHASLLRHSVQGRNGCGRLRALLAERYDDGPVPLSDWSRQAARRLVEHGLPAPALEHRVLDPTNGALVAQVDLAYPAQRVAIELQSKRWHLNHRSFEADPARWNCLTALGWQVYPVTWSFFHQETAELYRIIRVALDRANEPTANSVRPESHR